MGRTNGLGRFLYLSAPEGLDRLPMLVLDGQTYAPGTSVEPVKQTWHHYRLNDGQTHGPGTSVELALRDVGAMAMPDEGRVDVNVKRACELAVRIPEWVKPEECQCQVNGLAQPLSWDGRYALVGSVEPKEVITLTFPIFERTDVVSIEGQDHTLVRKGNDVVHIDPPGKYCPLYQRSHYRESQVQWRKMSRFVSPQLVDW